MTTLQKRRIFISYRRADSAGYAGRIYDRLAAHFGEDAIFMDVDAIEAGLDFVEVLENAVQSCDVLVALIGARWLNIKNSAGKRRLDNPEDFVRIEIAAALRRRIRVIPVLVAEANMPTSKELPHGLKKLARRNAVFVEHRSFHSDTNRLIEQLELALKAAEESKLFKKQALEEKEIQKKRQAEINSLLSQAEIAINLQDWELAKEKLDAVLILDPKNAQAQIKLMIAERKLAQIKTQESAREKAQREAIEKIAEEKARKEKEAREKKLAEEAAREKASKEREAQEKKEAEEKAREVAEEKESKRKVALEKTYQERIAREKLEAEEKAQQRTLKKERQQERVEKPQKISWRKEIFVGLGIVIFACLIFGGSSILKNILVSPSSTKIPSTEIPFTKTVSPTLSEAIVIASDATPYPEEISDIDPAGNKIPMRLVREGEFTMGSEQYDDEKPIHQVYLDAFYMDQYEVTNALYKACVEAGGCTEPQQQRSYTRSDYYGNEQYNNFPVIYVDWNQAKTYCEWRDADLPSEAQWEKSARGTDARTYPWGEEIDCNRANIYDYIIKKDYCIGDTTEVGSYESGKSPYGIYDLAGNVWEWVDDWYDAYPGNTIENPRYGTTYKVLRGGAWYGNGDDVRASNRDGYLPDYNNVDLGFRCVRSRP